MPHNIYISFWLSTRWAVMPMLAGSLVFFLWLPSLRWQNELFHVLIEGGGSIISFSLALFISGMLQNKRLPENYVWLIACFISMGILDMMHSLTHPGQAFVWLHSTATFIGGTFASFIWLSPVISKRFINKKMLLTLLISSLGFSIWSILSPDSTPTMLDQSKNFTIIAKFLNIAGGLGFLITWYYFSREYFKHQDSDFYYFSNHFCLFGLAGLLFETSSLWDGNWWLWHLLRIFAYILLMVHFSRMYWQDMKLLELQNKAKSDFLANMSHELRTPMHGILSYAKMGIDRIDRSPTEKLLRYFNNIQTSGLRLLHLLNDLLDLSKLEAGKTTLNIQEHDIDKIIYDCQTEFTAKLKEHNLTLIVESPPTSASLYCDEAGIKQVLINLLSNAIKHSPEGAKITISYIIVDKNISLKIIDQGVGIALDKLETIFNKFFQVNNKETGTGMGSTGLGLAICKEIIELHHGNIWAETCSKTNIGAILCFTIPLNYNDE